MENILITGGSGFIGANLAEYLIGKNIHPHIITGEKSRLWRIEKYLAANALSVYPIGLDDKSRLEETFRKINPSVVFHLASFGVSGQNTDRNMMERINIEGTGNILAVSRNFDLQAFVYTGTCFEYANRKNDLITENLVTGPFNFYGRTKLAGTNLCRKYAARYDIPAIIIRPFTAYGPWEDKNRFVAKTILSVLQNKPPEVNYSDPLRNFVYVGDIVAGLIKAQNAARTHRGEIINLGWDKEYRVSFAAKAICSLAKTEFSPVLIDESKYAVDNYHWAIDNSKAAKMLHWKPQTTLEEGLKRTIKWYRNHPGLYS